tara:strand:+ start:1967 stop:2347 length:381 start_codon:yes stop_codon:yes gene_type:complete
MILNKFSTIQILLLLFFICCGPNKKDNVKDAEKALDAFSKIDKQNEDLFTKKDRIAAYKSSIESSENQTKSLNKKSTYNGYGSQNKNNNLKGKKKKKSNPEQQNKKVNYSLKRNNISQTFSTYSTN